MAGGRAVPLTPNCFAFLRNTKWSPDAPPSTSAPKFWVVRVVAASPGPSGLACRLQWFQETEPGSGLYTQTPRVVTENLRALHPVGMAADAAAKAYRVTTPFDESVMFAEPRAGTPRT